MTSHGTRPPRLSALIAVVLALIAAPASAQEFRGGIAGTITDTTGGVLPGVTVTVTNAETGVAQPVVTDENGRYQPSFVSFVSIVFARRSNRLNASENGCKAPHYV